MRFDCTGFSGLYVVRPERNVDKRGHFARLFCEEQFAAAGLESNFPQISLSFNSRAGTVRGLHYQPAPHSETKLVRCTRGQIFDVVVDLRREEPTFLQWSGFELSADNGIALYIPAGFAHGFQTILDESDVLYAITPPYSPGLEAGVRWNDPAIDVRWPLPISVISDRDQAWPAIARQTS